MMSSSTEDYPYSFLKRFTLKNLQNLQPLNGWLLIHAIKKDSQDRSFIGRTLQ